MDIARGATQAFLCTNASAGYMWHLYYAWIWHWLNIHSFSEVLAENSKSSLRFGVPSLNLICTRDDGVGQT